MNIREKSTLQQHRRELVDDIILDEDLFAAMRKSKLFTQGMISIIQAELKPRDQCHKMLDLLEMRGPEAFDKFVRVLKENYYWLVHILEDTLTQRQAAQMSEFNQPPNRNETADKGPARIQSTPCKTLTARTNYAKMVPQSANQPDIQQHTAFFPNDFSSEAYPINEDLHFNRDDIADACCSPIHVIESPRKTLHKSCSPIPPEKIERHTSFDFDEIDAAHIPSTNSTYYNDIHTNKQIENIHRQMNELHEKLTNILKENEDIDFADNSSDTSEEDSADTTSSCGSPIPVTFESINELVDELVKRLDSAEAMAASFSACQSLIDSHDRKQPLERSIQQIIQKNKELEMKLRAEKVNIDKMADDMYKYSMDIKNIEKIQQKLQKAENDKKRLGAELKETEMLVSEKDKRIGDLEDQVRELEEWKASQQQEKKIVRRGNVCPPRSYRQAPSKRTIVPAGAPKLRLSLGGDGYQGIYKSPRGGNNQSKWKSTSLNKLI